MDIETGGWPFGDLKPLSDKKKAKALAEAVRLDKVKEFSNPDSPFFGLGIAQAYQVLSGSYQVLPEIIDRLHKHNLISPLAEAFALKHNLTVAQLLESAEETAMREQFVSLVNQVIDGLSDDDRHSLAGFVIQSPLLDPFNKKLGIEEPR